MLLPTVATATAALATLASGVDQPAGATFGMRKAMLVVAAVFVAIFVACVVVGNARARRRPPQAPTYPILEPPGGRTPSEQGPRNGPDASSRP